MEKLGLLGTGRRFEHELTAAILRMGRFVVTSGHGAILAETDGVNPTRVDPEADQLFAQRERASFAKRPVVFFGAALVAMALDFDGRVRVGFEIISNVADFGTLIFPHRRAVVIEMDGVRFENFVVTGPIFSSVGIAEGKSGAGSVGAVKIVGVRYRVAGSNVGGSATATAGQRGDGAGFFTATGGRQGDEQCEQQYFRKVGQLHFMCCLDGLSSPTGL